MIVSSAALRGDPNNGSGETKNKELKKKNWVPRNIHN